MSSSFSLDGYLQNICCNNKIRLGLIFVMAAKDSNINRKTKNYCDLGKRASAAFRINSIQWAENHNKTTTVKKKKKNTSQNNKQLKQQIQTYFSPSSARSSALSKSASTMANLRATYASFAGGKKYNNNNKIDVSFSFFSLHIWFAFEC